MIKYLYYINIAKYLEGLLNRQSNGISFDYQINIFDNIINELVIKKGCELIVLDNINSFDINFQLSEKTKEILHTYSTYYGYEKFITQARTTIISDAISRAVYDYVSSLKLKNHYIPEYKKTNKIITTEFNKYALKYAKVYFVEEEHIKNKLRMFQNTYLSVGNLRLA